MIAIVYPALCGTNLMVGHVGALYSSLSQSNFWLGHAAFAAASTAAILLFYCPLTEVRTPEQGTRISVRGYEVPDCGKPGLLSTSR